VRILVTGATGAFGAPLCAALAERGHEVRALARRRPATLPSGVTFVAGDIADSAAVDAAVDGVDRVVHLAWLVAVARDPSEAERINLTGTRNVLAAMARHDTEKLVFSSSVLAYGADPAHGPYREDDELRPDPLLQYGDHKRIVEEEIAASGVPAVVSRPATVIGRSVGSMSVQIFATPALVGVAGEDHPWQFVHQDDVQRFLLDAVEGDRTGTVNLAADGLVSHERLGDLLGRRAVRVPARLLKGAIGAAWSLHLSDVNPVAVETLRAFPVADTTRLRTEWNFDCAWTTDEAVIDTRRAIAGLNIVGQARLQRRDAPPLPPVGGLPPSDVDADLSARVAASRLAPCPHRKTRIAVEWAERESEMVLGSWSTDPRSDSDARHEARLHQLRDLSLDLLVLRDSVAGDPTARRRIDAAAATVLDALRDREEWSRRSETAGRP
jgi:nucleoside-diphosphate-sugar epimerase